MKTNQCNRNDRRSGPRRMRGVGLIEVLVAVAILAFGLLGIAAMQATALKNGESSYQRSQAVALTYSILDRMRANRGDAIIFNYDIPRTCNVPGTGDPVANDLHDWITSLHEVLGDKSCGTIDCEPATGGGVTVTQCDITVEWDDSRGTEGSTAQTLTTTTAI